MMNKSIVSTLSITLLLVASQIGAAQQSSQSPEPSRNIPSKVNSRKSVRNAPRVWTNDNLDSVLTPADVYEDEEETKAAEASKNKKEESSTSSTSHSETVGAPPAFTDPKNTADADRMIKWEDRDILAQQQMVRRVQQELNNAPVDQKDHFQKMLAHYQQVLESTRAERTALVKKKAKMDLASETRGSAEVSPTQ